MEVLSTADSVLLLGDLLYALAFVLSSKVEFCTSNTDEKLENILFQNLCRRKRTCKKNEPTTKTKPSTQLPEDLEPPGIFVCTGKVLHDFRHQLNDIPFLQGRDVFFSQPRMGITRTTTLALLCCF